MDDKIKQLLNCLVDEFYDVASLYTRLNNNSAPVPLYGNLPTKESHVLVFIGRTPDITITDLATRFAVTKGAMSKTISKLSSMKFLGKSVSDESGREIKLSLTKKGQEVYEAHEARVRSNRAQMHKRFEHLSLSNIASIAMFLEEVKKILEDYSMLVNSDEDLDVDNDTDL
ncbi:MAG: MarR family transcriptional regulator [Deltaproteobacteria bacterium]|nr:MarR family transcriptional regulator [Deltaproteobacteria bacterium]